MTTLNGIIETQGYLAAAERLMSEEERFAVVDMIAANPEGGVPIPGARGLRKMRIPLRGRGKRGGGRVIYWFHSAGFPVALLTVFAKSDIGDMRLDQRKRFIAIGEAIIEQLGGK